MKTKNNSLHKYSTHEIIDYLREERKVIIPVFIEKWVMEYWLEGQFTPEQFEDFQKLIKTEFNAYFFDEIREWALYRHEENHIIDPRPEPNPEDLPF
jgi:hypothetical protein